MAKKKSTKKSASRPVNAEGKQPIVVFDLTGRVVFRPGEEPWEGEPLADRHHALLESEARQKIQNLAGEGLVVGLLGVEPHRAEVRNPKLRGPKSLPAHQAGEVIDEAARRGSCSCCS